MPRTYFTPHTTQSTAEPITGVICPTTPSNIYEACEYVIPDNDTTAIWFIREGKINAYTPDILTDNLHEILGYMSTLYPTGNIAIKTRHANDMPKYNDATWRNANHIYTLNDNHTYNIIAPNRNLLWRNKTAYKSYTSYNSTTSPSNTHQATSTNIHNEIKNIREHIEEYVKKNSKSNDNILVPNGPEISITHLPTSIKDNEKIYPFMQMEIETDIDEVSKCIYAIEDAIIDTKTLKYKTFDNANIMISTITEKYKNIFNTWIKPNHVFNIIKYISCTILSNTPGYIRPDDITNIFAARLYNQITNKNIDQCIKLFTDTTGKTGHDPEYKYFVTILIEECMENPDAETLKKLLTNTPPNIINPEDYLSIRTHFDHKHHHDIINTLKTVSPVYSWADIVK